MKWAKYSTIIVIISSILGSNAHARVEDKESLLILGDSHIAGAIGDGLNLGLSSKFQVTQVGSCGARAQSYLTDYTTKCGFTWKSQTKNIKTQESLTPKASDLFKLKPDTVVISLGTNFINQSPAAIKSEAGRLLDQVPKNTPCFWIGPPDIRGTEKKDKIIAVEQTLQSFLSKKNCTYISILNELEYPPSGGDGIHFGTKDGKMLGLRASQKILKFISENKIARPKTESFVDPEKLKTSLGTR